MSVFSGMMASSCKVISPGTITYDAYGEAVSGSPVETGPYRCYFFRPVGTVINPTSGAHEKLSLRVMLPASVYVHKGYHIRGLSAGYQDTYDVQSVEPALHMGVLDHWECDLEKVE